MSDPQAYPGSRYHLFIPGPSPVPARILREISMPTIDHRGPEFAVLGRKVLAGMQTVFGTRHPVVIYPASGTGAWEAALVNVLNPGDAVLMYETGHFASLWRAMAEHLGFQAEVLTDEGVCPRTGVPAGWRRPVSAERIHERLRHDTQHLIKAVCVVHNETSTGATSDIARVRQAIDAAGHPALLMVDTISGLGSIDYRHDEWGVDVSISGAQKGLMLPAGISFNALSPKAIEASETAGHPRSYWAWNDMLEFNVKGYWPYTPNTNLLFGLAAALEMLEAEGMAAVFARHRRLAAACRAAVQAWGLEVQCEVDEACSPVLTGVLLPAGQNADALRQALYERFQLSLGAGLGKVAGRMFRIGHLGNCSEIDLMGVLGAVELGFKRAGLPLSGSGVAAAIDVLDQGADVRG